MKKIKWILLVVLVLAAAGYGGLWFTQAKVAKDQVTNMLASLNQQGEYLTYESITSTGFPLEVGVSINNPVLNLPLSTMLKPLAQSMPITPDGSDAADMRKSLLNLPDWQERIALDGRILITVNALSNAYTITPEGSYSGTSSLAEETTQYNVTTNSNPRGCHLQFKEAIASESFLNLWNWQALSQNPEALLKNLQRFNCDIPGYEYTYDNAPVLTAKPASLAFSNQTSGDMLDMNFELNAKGLKATEAYDALVNRYYQAIYGTTLPKHYSISQYGEQSFSLKGLVKLNEKEPQLHPIHVELGDFTFTSDITNSTYSLRVKANPTGNMSGNGEIYSKMTLNSNETGYQLYLSQADEFANNLLSQLPPAQAKLINKEALNAAMRKIVPKIHELGELMYELDVKADAKEAGAIDVSLDNIEFGATPYGLKAVGKLNIASILLPIPTGNIDLTCRNCTNFVNDLAAWADTLKPLIAMTDQSHAYDDFIRLDTRAVGTALIGFLRKTDPKGVDNLNFAIELTPEGAFTVNGLTADILAAMAQEDLLPLLAPPAEPVAEPTDETAAETSNQ